MTLNEVCNREHIKNQKSARKFPTTTEIVALWKCDWIPRARQKSCPGPKSCTRGTKTSLTRTRGSKESGLLQTQRTECSTSSLVMTHKMRTWYSITLKTHNKGSSSNALETICATLSPVMTTRKRKRESSHTRDAELNRLDPRPEDRICYIISSHDLRIV